MRKLTRKQVIEAIKVASALGDKQAAMRLYVENRISLQAFADAVHAGRKMGERWKNEDIST